MRSCRKNGTNEDHKHPRD